MATKVLGIDVDDELIDKWKTWLAPARQPFFVETGGQKSWEMSDELRDTYRLWRIDRSLRVRWLDEDEFFAMPRAERAVLVREQERHKRGAVPSARRWADLVDARSQADGHRFVWWPSLITREVLARQVSLNGLVSRHGETQWTHPLAGTYPDGSRGNCFATAMAAFGDAKGDEWMVQEPFEDWLASRFCKGGSDSEPGTVLVWREAGLPAHAAVALGDGWAFEKSSQEWYTARTVASIADVKRKNRVRGWRLERHRLR
jgi:hypothetical protein